MTIWRLMRKEIAHRPGNFLLAVVAVTVAAGVVVTAVMALQAHGLATEQRLNRMRDEADQRLAAMEDDYRKYMKELGYNLLILPAAQDLTEFWTRGYAEHTMPQDHVAKLANSNTYTMRHLLPLVQQQVYWPQQKRTITLIGTRGEVPLAHRKPKEPMLLAVPEGEAVVGYQLARDLKLNPGGTINLLGRTFTVAKIVPERGSRDDSTIWIDLAAAQQLLDMPGRINAIEALKCFCAGAGVEKLRKEVASVLPDATVIVRQNEVTVRAKARARAKAEHEEALAAERANRKELRQSREMFAAVLSPSVIVGATVWIGLLAYGNVRQRAGEIAILRALGVRSARVFKLFLSRAVLIGLIGAGAGCVAGAGTGGWLAARLEPVLDPAGTLVVLPWTLLAGTIAAAPLLSAAASWAPSLLAARQNPADILASE